MKILVAAIADHAWVENSCLSLFRTIDMVNAQKFPYTLPRISVALRLVFNRSEAGIHKMNISGNAVMRSNRIFSMSYKPEVKPAGSLLCAS